MNKRADFYILSTTEPSKRWLFACQLIEKAYNNGLSLFVWTENAEDAATIDDQLWQFKPTSFVPHVIEGSEQAAGITATITIGQTLSNAIECDAVVNLTDQLPNDPSRFTRIFEVIASDPECQQHARERFKHYRTEGFELNTHKIN